MCGDSVAAVQQRFAMAKRFLSYKDLKGHCASRMFKLRPHSDPEKIQWTWTRRSWSIPTPSNSVIHRHVYSLQGNEMAFAGLSGSFHWGSQKHPRMRLFMAHDRNDAPSRLAPVCTALHCAVVDALDQSISCSVFCIGADLCDAVWILFMFSFLPSANSSKRMKKTT